jgi:prepilin peptidase CpaA
MGWGLLSIALLACLLISAGVEDVRRREIANWKNAAIALLAPLWWWSNGVALWPDLVLQLSAAVVIFAFFCVAFHFGWMGGGDVKMIGALSLWLPLTALVGMLLVMSIIGGMLTLIMVAEHRVRRKTEPLEVPYGVAIAIAGLLALREPLLNQFT